MLSLFYLPRATSLYALVKIRVHCTLNVWNYFITRLFLNHFHQWPGSPKGRTFNFLPCSILTTIVIQKIVAGSDLDEKICPWKRLPDDSSPGNSALLRTRRNTRADSQIMLHPCASVKVTGAQPWQRPTPAETGDDFCVTANAGLL